MRTNRHQHTLRASYILSMLLALMVAGATLPGAAQGRQTTPPPTGGVVQGWVRDHATGRGVQATVRIGSHTLHTAADGSLPTTTIPFSSPTLDVVVVAEAPGYPTWRFDGVRLAQSHPVELQIELGAPSTPTETGVTAAHHDLLAATPASTYLDRPPDFINIGRTFNTTCVYPPSNVQRIDRVPFMVYVRNVLPFEWISSWPAASLDAGAVAASQFAWSTALVQRKWTRHGYAFDVLDSTCDQVYKDRTPTQNFPHTDAAVARMWGTVLLRDDKLITTYFRDTDERCEKYGGPDCMGQYGSRDRANEGMDGVEILQHYYDPITPTVRLAQHRAVVWERSPNPVLQPGATQTITVRLLNVGASTWERAYTELRVVDPEDASNTAYRSPFVHSSWLDATHPTELSVASVALGQHDTFHITIAAPSTMNPGKYQFALRWQHRDGTPIATEPALIWNVFVVEPKVLVPLATP